MATTIQTLSKERISNLISSKFGSIMSDRDFEVMDYCQTMGDVYVGYVDGDFVCCWGLIPPSFLSDQAYLWMWAPKEIKHQFVFIRQSQIQVKKMLAKYQSIAGHCLKESRSAQRWLRWLGAKFESGPGDILTFVIGRA